MFMLRGASWYNSALCFAFGQTSTGNRISGFLKNKHTMICTLLVANIRNSLAVGKIILALFNHFKRY